jgi:hypothetical protein
MYRMQIQVQAQQHAVLLLALHSIVAPRDLWYMQ